MIKGDYEKLAVIAHENVCAKCGSALSVATLPGEGCFVLRCTCPEPTEAVRHNPTNSESHRQGVDMEIGKTPLEERTRLAKIKQPNPIPKEQALALLPKKDLGDFSVLTHSQVQALIDYADQYGLDPYRGHVVMYFGAPYIGLDGYLFKAHQSGKLFNLNSKPMSQEERTLYMVGEGDHAWLSEVHLHEGNQTFSGVGIVTAAEMAEHSTKSPEKLRSPVVAAHPWLLAQKRAEWQALRRAFPIGETTKEEI
jgi:hypothetical protein